MRSTPILRHVIGSGFKLDVEAVVSADRRYVTMTVIFAAVRADRPAVRRRSQGGAGGGFGGRWRRRDPVRCATIQLPIIEVSQVQHDGHRSRQAARSLLGGQRSTSEEFETETGVPILSKIPFINRFFTNRQTSKTEQTLLILIRPEIIIQQENEDILFPGLSDQIGAGAAYLR